MNGGRQMFVGTLYALVIVVASASSGISGTSLELDEQESLDKSCLLQSNLAGDIVHAPVSRVRNALIVIPDDEETVNKTVTGNETVVVNVTENVTRDDGKASNVTTNVSANTKEIKIEHKVVDSNGQKKVRVTKTELKNKTSSDKHHILPKQTTDEEDDKEAAKDKARHPEKAEEPFAKENVTVHRRVLNITRRMNSTHNETQNVTIKEVVKTVEVASPFHITSIYIILFVPVIVAWALYYQHGQQPQHYVWLLPFTMCTMGVGQDLVNQSLTLILMAPNAITAIQAFSMCIATGLWCVCMNWQALSEINFLTVCKWLPVAVFFSIYQLMNHLVYALCSLSERTVITNLSPLIVLAMESALFSVLLQPKVSFKGKMALALMVIGAFLFSIQSPSFTLNGLSIATVLLLATVPYRLAQRHFLANGSGSGSEFPLAVLACIDGLMLGAPAIGISFARNGHFFTDFEAFQDTSIVFMLVLSVVTFIGLHIATLAMLRLGTATTYLVFSNIGSLATIALGIFFFGDRALGTAMACIGLFTNVASGMWYSAEVQPSMSDEPSAEKLDTEPLEKPQQKVTS